ncbi:MAG: hypothetical protein AAGF66_01265 [Cyanobacteria bacterium P01_H01_bin.119]
MRTCDREDFAKGLEPDHCHYIQHKAQVHGGAQVDLNQFPLPDLAVEIDITSRSPERFAIYKPLGIPKICRYDGRYRKTGNCSMDKLNLHRQLVQESLIKTANLRSHIDLVKSKTVFDRKGDYYQLVHLA